MVELEPAVLPDAPYSFTPACSMCGRAISVVVTPQTDWICCASCAVASGWKPRANESDGTAEAAYLDRNLAVMAWATALHEAGRRVGWRDRDTAWPILMMDLPSGQVSYHIPRQEAEFGFGLPHYPAEWDGHDLLTKQQRVLRTILEDA